MPAISSSAWKVRTPKFLCLLSSCRMSEAACDRVRAQEQRKVRLSGRGDQSVGQREVPGDVAVGADREGLGRRGDLVGDGEVLGGLAEVPARPEGGQVRLGDLRLPRELRPQELLRALGGPVVHPRQEAEREHVLAALGLLATEVEILEGLDGQRGQGDRMKAVTVERSILQRRGRVPHFLHRPFGELVRVDDDLRTARQVGDVGLEGGGVHGHQHVGRVTRREDVVVGEVQLEGGDTREGSGRGPDLGGEVGKGGQVVAEGRGLRGETVPGELHPVTGVPRETNDHPVEAADVLHMRPLCAALLRRLRRPAPLGC